MTTTSPNLKQIYAEYRKAGFDAAEALELAQEAIEKAKPQPKEGTQQKSAPRTANEWALGAVLLIAGGIAWLMGAKYTLLGWSTGANLFLAWLGLPVRAPMPDGWFILLAIPLGLMYSRVETRVWHRRSNTLMRAPLFWLGWIILVLSDVATTFLGVRAVNQDSWYIAQQIAASGWVSAAWAIVLTFAPEWSILGGMRFLRR